MERIKVEVQAQHKHMTNQAKALRIALERTVGTDGLRDKVVNKFIGYLQTNARAKEPSAEEQKQA